MRKSQSSRKRKKPQWRKDRKLKQRLKNKLDNHRRKAGGRFTVQQWLKKLRLFDHCCAYCGDHQDVCGTLEVEHMVPINRGGKNEDSNIVPACRRCNAQKGEYTLIEWHEKLKLNEETKEIENG